MIKVQAVEPLPLDLLDHVTTSEQSQVQLRSPRPVIEAAQALTRTVTDWTNVQATGADQEMLAASSVLRDKISDFTIAVRSGLTSGSNDSPNTGLFRQLRRPTRSHE